MGCERDWRDKCEEEAARRLKPGWLDHELRIAQIEAEEMTRARQRIAKRVKSLDRQFAKD